MGDGRSADAYVEVCDEPEHRRCLENECVYAYRVILAPEQATLWHRHAEDTLYFSLADGRAREDLPHRDPVLTDVPCGAAVSRPHRREPLIHRVTNVGAGTFHVIGAEARRRPATGRERPLDAVGYALAVETDRLRAYRVSTAQPATSVRHGAAGLLVAGAPCTLRLPGDTAARRMARGALLWLEPPAAVTFESPFDGFFAEWRS